MPTLAIYANEIDIPFVSLQNTVGWKFTQPLANEGDLCRQEKGFVIV